MTMLDVVYVDTVEEQRVVAIRPKPAFRPLFEIATTREGSGIVLVTEKREDEDGQVARTTEAPPPGGQGADAIPCSWWRRGRVELPVQKSPSSRMYYRLSWSLGLAPNCPNQRRAPLGASR